MKKHSPLVAMSAAWATSNVAQAAIAFVTSLVIARGLGADGFGRWTLCMAWAATLTMVFDLGFGVLLTREAARESAEVGRMVGAALVARLGLLAPAAVIFAAAAPWLATEPSTAAAFRIVPLIAAAGIAYTCLAGVFRASPRSLVTVLTIEATGALMQCGAAWWMVRRGGGVVDLLRVAASIQLAQFAAVVVLWRFSPLCGSKREFRTRSSEPHNGLGAHSAPASRGPQRAFCARWGGMERSGAQGSPRVTEPGSGAEPRSSWPRHGEMAWPSRTTLRVTVGRAWPFALAGLVANAQLRLAPLVLGFLSSAVAVASFGVAARIGSLVRMLPQSGFAGALPALTSELRGGDARTMRSRFDVIVQAFAVISALVIAVFARPIVRVVYGAQFSAAASPLVWMAIGLIPTLVNGGRKVFLYAAGHEQVAVRWSAVALAIQALGCVLLIPSFGASGAAAALTIGEAAVWWPLQRSASRAASHGVSGFSRTETSGPPEGGHYVGPAEVSVL